MAGGSPITVSWSGMTDGIEHAPWRRVRPPTVRRTRTRRTGSTCRAVRLHEHRLAGDELPPPEVEAVPEVTMTLFPLFSVRTTRIGVRPAPTTSRSAYCLVVVLDDLLPRPAVVGVPEGTPLAHPPSMAVAVPRQADGRRRVRLDGRGGDHDPGERQHERRAGQGGYEGSTQPPGGTASGPWRRLDAGDAWSAGPTRPSTIRPSHGRCGGRPPGHEQVSMQSSALPDSRRTPGTTRRSDPSRSPAGSDPVSRTHGVAQAPAAWSRRTRRRRRRRCRRRTPPSSSRRPRIRTPSRAPAGRAPGCRSNRRTSPTRS